MSAHNAFTFLMIHSIYYSITLRANFWDPQMLTVYVGGSVQCVVFYNVQFASVFLTSLPLKSW